MHFHNEVILEDDFISVEKSSETDKNNGTSTNERKVHKLKKGGEKVGKILYLFFFILKGFLGQLLSMDGFLSVIRGLLLQTALLYLEVFREPEWFVCIQFNLI